MITEGEGVPEEDGQGRGGDRNPPTTRATEARGDGGRDKERMDGPGTAPPPHPQRGAASDNNIAGTLLRHTAGTDSARPEHGALTRLEYNLLAPAGLALDTDSVGDQESGDRHEATRETADQAQRETGSGDGTRQRALPARGIQEINDEEQRPPKWSRALNACGRQGGEGEEGPPTQKLTTTASI